MDNLEETDVSKIVTTSTRFENGVYTVVETTTVTKTKVLPSPVKETPLSPVQAASHGQDNSTVSKLITNLDAEIQRSSENAEVSGGDIETISKNIESERQAVNHSSERVVSETHEAHSSSTHFSSLKQKIQVSSEQITTTQLEIRSSSDRITKLQSQAELEKSGSSFKSGSDDGEWFVSEISEDQSNWVVSEQVGLRGAKRRKQNGDGQDYADSEDIDEVDEANETLIEAQNDTTIEACMHDKTEDSSMIGFKEGTKEVGSTGEITVTEKTQITTNEGRTVYYVVRKETSLTTETERTGESYIESQMSNLERITNAEMAHTSQSNSNESVKESGIQYIADATDKTISDESVAQEVDEVAKDITDTLELLGENVDGDNSQPIETQTDRNAEKSMQTETNDAASPEEITIQEVCETIVSASMTTSETQSLDTVTTESVISSQMETSQQDMSPEYKTEQTEDDVVDEVGMDITTQEALELSDESAPNANSDDAIQTEDIPEHVDEIHTAPEIPDKEEPQAEAQVSVDDTVDEVGEDIAQQEQLALSGKLSSGDETELKPNGVQEETIADKSENQSSQAKQVDQIEDDSNYLNDVSNTSEVTESIQNTTYMCALEEEATQPTLNEVSKCDIQYESEETSEDILYNEVNTGEPDLTPEIDISLLSSQREKMDSVHEQMHLGNTDTLLNITEPNQGQDITGDAERLDNEATKYTEQGEDDDHGQSDNKITDDANEAEIEEALDSGEPEEAFEEISYEDKGEDEEVEEDPGTSTSEQMTTQESLDYPEDMVEENVPEQENTKDSLLSDEGNINADTDCTNVTDGTEGDKYSLSTIDSKTKEQDNIVWETVTEVTENVIEISKQQVTNVSYSATYQMKSTEHEQSHTMCEDETLEVQTNTESAVANDTVEPNDSVARAEEAYDQSLESSGEYHSKNEKSELCNEDQFIQENLSKLEKERAQILGDSDSPSVEPVYQVEEDNDSSAHDQDEIKTEDEGFHDTEEVARHTQADNLETYTSHIETRSEKLPVSLDNDNQEQEQKLEKEITEASSYYEKYYASKSADVSQDSQSDFPSNFKERFKVVTASERLNIKPEKPIYIFLLHVEEQENDASEAVREYVSSNSKIDSGETRLRPAIRGSAASFGIWRKPKQAVDIGKGYHAMLINDFIPRGSQYKWLDMSASMEDGNQDPTTGFIYEPAPFIDRVCDFTECKAGKEVALLINKWADYSHTIKYESLEDWNLEELTKLNTAYSEDTSPRLDTQLKPRRFDADTSFEILQAVIDDTPVEKHKKSPSMTEDRGDEQDREAHDDGKTSLGGAILNFFNIPGGRNKDIDDDMDETNGPASPSIFDSIPVTSTPLPENYRKGSADSTAKETPSQTEEAQFLNMDDGVLGGHDKSSFLEKAKDFFNIPEEEPEERVELVEDVSLENRSITPSKVHASDMEQYNAEPHFAQVVRTEKTTTKISSFSLQDFREGNQKQDKKITLKQDDLIAVFRTPDSSPSDTARGYDDDDVISEQVDTERERALSEKTLTDIMLEENADSEVPSQDDERDGKHGENKRSFADQIKEFFTLKPKTSEHQAEGKEKETDEDLAPEQRNQLTKEQREIAPADVENKKSNDDDIKGAHENEEDGAPFAEKIKAFCSVKEKATRVVDENEISGNVDDLPPETPPLNTQIKAFFNMNSKITADDLPKAETQSELEEAQSNKDNDTCTTTLGTQITAFFTNRVNAEQTDAGTDVDKHVVENADDDNAQSNNHVLNDDNVDSKADDKDSNEGHIPQDGDHSEKLSVGEQIKAFFKIKSRHITRMNAEAGTADIESSEIPQSDVYNQENAEEKPASKDDEVNDGGVESIPAETTDATEHEGGHGGKLTVGEQIKAFFTIKSKATSKVEVAVAHPESSETNTPQTEVNISEDRERDIDKQDGKLTIGQQIKSIFTIKSKSSTTATDHAEGEDVTATKRSDEYDNLMPTITPKSPDVTHDAEMHRTENAQITATNENIQMGEESDNTVKDTEETEEQPSLTDRIRNVFVIPPEPKLPTSTNTATSEDSTLDAKYAECIANVEVDERSQEAQNAGQQVSFLDRIKNAFAISSKDEETNPDSDQIHEEVDVERLENEPTTIDTATKTFGDELENGNILHTETRPLPTDTDTKQDDEDENDDFEAGNISMSEKIQGFFNIPPQVEEVYSSGISDNSVKTSRQKQTEEEQSGIELETDGGADQQASKSFIERLKGFFTRSPAKSDQNSDDPQQSVDDGNTEATIMNQETHNDNEERVDDAHPSTEPDSKESEQLLEETQNIGETETVSDLNEPKEESCHKPMSRATLISRIPRVAQDNYSKDNEAKQESSQNSETHTTVVENVETTLVSKIPRRGLTYNISTQAKEGEVVIKDVAEKMQENASKVNEALEKTEIKTVTTASRIPSISSKTTRSTITQRTKTTVAEGIVSTTEKISGSSNIPRIPRLQPKDDDVNRSSKPESSNSFGTASTSEYTSRATEEDKRTEMSVKSQIPIRGEWIRRVTTNEQSSSSSARWDAAAEHDSGIQDYQKETGSRFFDSSSNSDNKTDSSGRYCDGTSTETDVTQVTVIEVTRFHDDHAGEQEPPTPPAQRRDSGEKTLIQRVYDNFSKMKLTPERAKKEKTGIDSVDNNNSQEIIRQSFGDRSGSGRESGSESGKTPAYPALEFWRIFFNIPKAPEMIEEPTVHREVEGTSM